MLDAVAARVSAGGDPLERVEGGLDRAIPLRVHADLQVLGGEGGYQRGQFGPVIGQDAAAVRRDRVGAVDGGGTAAHPAVGPDLGGASGEVSGPRALQPGRLQPVRLVVHDHRVHALAERPRLVRLRERGKRVAARIGVADRGDAERGEPLARAPGQADALGGAHRGDVAGQIPFEQGEHRPLEDHPIEAALVVAAKCAARRVRLAVLEAGLAQRRRVEHAGMQRRVKKDGRTIGDRLVQFGPGRVPAFTQLVLDVARTGHPPAGRGGQTGLAQAGLDGRDVGGAGLGAVRGQG
jgi:hypothetical protein